MSLGKVWVFAEADGDKVKTITLEMLAKAREIGDTVEAVFGGARRCGRGDARRARRVEGVRDR